MTQPAKAQDPSMEEILASIRRVITQDDSAGAAASDVKAAVAIDPARGSPSETTPSKMSAVAAGPSARASAAGASNGSARDGWESASGPFGKRAAGTPHEPLAPTRDASLSEPAGRAERRQERAATMRPSDGPSANEPPLLSPASAATVNAAFDALAQAMPSPPTLEDIVRDMLRPMLRAWLDDNLPPMVERMVRAEIERLSRAR